CCGEAVHDCDPLNLIRLIPVEGVAMTTAIPLTLHLLVLIGLYEMAAGLAGFTGRIDWPAMLDEFERSPALTFVTGLAAFAIGAAIPPNTHPWTAGPGRL